jgi:adenosine deaminase
MLKATQLWLRNLLARQEISIEGNPSSNLLIGDHVAAENLPLFKLCQRDPGGGADLCVSISSDDPVTFATRLADEYAYSYFALLRSGLSATEALAWLRKRCQEGWNSRFTLEASVARPPGKASA